MARGIPREVIEHFRSVPLFSKLSQKGIRSVVSAANELDVKAGTVLVREGDLGRELYVIVDGEATVTRGGRRAGTLRTGDFFGEMAFLDHGPRTATVTAARDMRVMILGPRELEVLVKDEPAVTMGMLSAVASRVRAASRTRVD